tara:strand:+ start:68 stop:220 length:153 start_codon:yes stop_codon:yes gene_type:complete
MKKIVLIIATLVLTSCTGYDMSDINKKIKNIGKNPCYDKETNTVKIGCKK